jgi:hypothetical protein
MWHAGRALPYEVINSIFIFLLFHRASPQLTFSILKKLLNQVTLTRNLELPEDDLNNDRNMLERF